MTFEEADVIIDSFVEKYKIFNLKKLDLKVYPIDDLLCSVGRLKHAHYCFAEHMIKNEKMNKKIGDLLIESYSYIARFIDEDLDSINRINSGNTSYMDGLNKSKFIMTKNLDYVNSRLLENKIEFNNFLAECQKRNIS